MIKSFVSSVTIAMCVLVALTSFADNHGELPEGYKLQYQQDFKNKSAMNDFVFTDPSAWTYTKTDDEAYLDLKGKSKYKTKVRSPFNIGLIKKMQFRSYVLDVKMKQTGKEYGHRDMCVFFNFNTRSKYYYSHIATKTDPHAHNIFIVNEKPRTKVSIKTTSGHDWGKDKWHNVRIKRDADSGLIEVFVNDMSKPIMVAKDKTFGFGYIGFGSFDDTGRVKDIKIYAKEVKKVDAGDPFKDGRPEK